MCEILDFTRNCDLPNPPGLLLDLYYCPADEFNGWPAVKSEMDPAGTDLGDKVTLGEAFSFVSTVGKGYWRKTKILTDTGNVMADAVGEKGSKAWDHALNFAMAGSDAEELEFLHNVVLCDNCGGLVYMVVDRNDNRRVIGTNALPASIDKLSNDTGAKNGDKRGSTWAIKSPSSRPALFYDKVLAINVTPND